MANGLNRLERFFSKRKTSTTVSDPRPASSSRMSSEQQFPSPSFIRPKANRMAAREECRSKQIPSRSPSVPDLLMSNRMMSVHTRDSSSTNSSPRQKLYPARSASTRARHPDFLVSALNEFKFPEPPSYHGDTSPLSLTFSSKSASESRHQGSPRSRSPLDVSIPPSRLDTPPSSDPGDDETSPRDYYTKKLPAIPPPHRAPPTPDESPDLGPVPDSKLRLSKSVDILDKSLYKAIHLQLGEPFEQSLLRRSHSQTSLLPSARFSQCSSTLREPNFNDFLELSDDDIAETTPGSPIIESSLDLPAFSSSVPALKQMAPSLLTLAPPVASPAATAAAFEAARIANRYDFDLVYVVNLWPANEYASQISSPHLTSTAGHDSTQAQYPMMGRLLAAHGLHHVPSPLQISSGVHCKVLRSDGWIEYRNQEAKSGDLARGYACAFYPGESLRNGSVDSNVPVSGVRLSERIDRGIVFAAYRRPKVDGSAVGAALEKEDLGHLHNDAEALVDMVIDIHVTSQLRQYCSLDGLSENIGTIPSSIDIV